MYLTLNSTNRLWPPAPSTTQNEESEITRRPGDLRPTCSPYGPQTQSAHPNGPWDNLNYQPSSGLPFVLPDDADHSIFAFGGSCLPYVPDLIQPEFQLQESMLPPYPSADLDALMGTNFAFGFVDTSQAAHDDGRHGIEAVSTTAYNGFSSSVESISTVHCQAAAAPQLSTAWNQEAMSHGAPSLAGCSSGGSHTNNENLGVQREALVATANQLLQLASCMQ